MNSLQSLEWRHFLVNLSRFRLVYEDQMTVMPFKQAWVDSINLKKYIKKSLPHLRYHILFYFRQDQPDKF